MTTPERLRRRQRREEILLICLGIAVGVASFYFHSQDVKQADCFRTRFADLSSNLDARGQIAQREAKASRLEAKATRLESRANNDFYKAAFASTALPDVFDAYGQYRVSLAQVNALRVRVDNRREQIAKDRADNPIPDFPAGSCN